jgi:hypothetical protein
MKIRTATGQILHVEKSPVTQILIDAGLATIVTELLTPVPSLTTWEFGFPNEAVDIKHVEVRLEARCSNKRCIKAAVVLRTYSRTHRQICSLRPCRFLPC